MDNMSEVRQMVKEFAIRNISVPQVKFIADDPEGVEIKRIGEAGLWNRVFLVVSSDRKESVVLKNAQEKLSYQESTPSERTLSVDRLAVDYASLCLLHEVHLGCVPQPYCYDRQTNIVAMEDLTHMELLATDLRAAPQPELARRMGMDLGRIHYVSHHKRVSEKTWQRYLHALNYPSFMEDLIDMRYRLRFIETSPEVSVQEENLEMFRRCVTELRSNEILEVIPKLVMRPDCLIHTDPHMYSVLYSPHRMAFVDFESGGMGNQSFSVAYASGFFIMCMMEVQGKTESDQRHDVMLQTRQAITNLVQSFLEEFGEERDILGSMKDFISDMALQAGYTIFALPNVRGLDKLVTLSVQQRYSLLDKGFNLMMKYKEITSLEQFLDISLAQ